MPLFTSKSFKITGICDIKSESKIDEVIGNLKPDETKYLKFGKETIIISLSKDGKISMITKKGNKIRKEIIDQW